MQHVTARALWLPPSFPAMTIECLPASGPGCMPWLHSYPTTLQFSLLHPDFHKKIKIGKKKYTPWSHSSSVCTQRSVAKDVLWSTCKPQANHHCSNLPSAFVVQEHNPAGLLVSLPAGLLQALCQRHSLTCFMYLHFLPLDDTMENNSRPLGS